MKYLLLLFFYPLHLSAQKVKRKDSEKIYRAVIYNNFGKKRQTIMVADSMVNRSIKNWNFTRFAEDYNRTGNILWGDMNLDSSWKKVFEMANYKVQFLSKGKVPEIDLDSITMKYANKDSMNKYSLKSTFSEFRKKFGSEIRIELSDILFFTNKAIVEMNNATGSFGGEDILYFLERKKNTWVVVSYVPTWN